MYSYLTILGYNCNLLPGNAAVYMFADGGCKVLEVMSFNEGCRSWFIGNYVQSGELQESLAGAISKCDISIMAFK